MADSLNTLLQKKKEIEERIRELSNPNEIFIKQMYGKDSAWHLVIRPRWKGIEAPYIRRGTQVNKTIVFGMKKEDVVNAIPELIEELKAVYALEKCNE